MGTPLSSSCAAVALALLAAGACAQVQLPFPLEPTPAMRADAAELVELSRNARFFPLHEALDRLVSSDPAKRRQAGERLLAVLVGAKERLDAPPSADDGGAERNLRFDLERDIGWLAARIGNLPLDGAAVEAIPAAWWLWRNGADGETRTHAVGALARIRCAATDPFFVAVLRDGSPSVAAITWALAEAGPRGLPVDDGALAGLAVHYDAGVRERAAHLLRDRGLAVPEYVPGRSFGRVVDDVLALVPDLLPAPVAAATPWVVLRLPATQWSPEREVEGWLVQRGEAQRAWRLLLADGTLLDWPAEGVTCRDASLAAHIDAFVERRAAWLATEDMGARERIENELGIMRSFRSSSEPWPGSPRELVLAAIARRAGDAARADALLGPLLQNGGDADDVLVPRLDAISKELDRAMLAAFADGRDYDRAIELARRLMHPALVHWHERSRAAELLDQLPRRRGDFAALQLATPEQWKVHTQELSRGQQIAWLVERLRLLSCQQTSNPGWLDYGQPQYAAAHVWGAPDAPAEVINPFRELLDMNLAIDELPALLPALQSRDFVLAYDLYRFDFGYPMSLHRVAWVAATIVNEVCQDAVVDPREFLADDADGRARAAATFLAFCRNNAGKTRADLLAARLAAAAEWQDVRLAFWRLYAVDEVRACTAILAATQRRPAELPQVVRLFCLLDRGEYVGEGRGWLEHESAEARLFAAALLLRHGVEPERSLAVLARELEDPVLAADIAGVADALLASKLPAARTLLLEFLAGTHRSGCRPTLALVKRLWRAGWPEAHAALRAAATGERELLVHPALADEPEEMRRTMLRAGLASWWPERFANGEPAPAALEQALQEDWQRIGRGEAPTCRTDEDDLPWGELRSFSTGWIRRM